MNLINRTDRLYIALVDTPGIFATLIRWHIKQPYIHVALGFDPDMREAYSIGRRNVKIPFFAGFEQEEIPKIARQYPEAGYKVFSIECTAEQKKEIRKYMHEMYEMRYSTHYTILGLPFLVFGRKFHQKNTYTCSSFIGKVLKDFDVYDFQKDFSLVTPKDFYHMEYSEQIYEGSIQGLLKEQDEEEFINSNHIFGFGWRDVMDIVQRQ